MDIFCCNVLVVSFEFARFWLAKTKRIRRLLYVCKTYPILKIKLETLLPSVDLRLQNYNIFLKCANIFDYFLQKKLNLHFLRLFEIV